MLNCSTRRVNRPTQRSQQGRSCSSRWQSSSLKWHRDSLAMWIRRSRSSFIHRPAALPLLLMHFSPCSLVLALSLVCLSPPLFLSSSFPSLQRRTAFLCASLVHSLSHSFNTPPIMFDKTALCPNPIRRTSRLRWGQMKPRLQEHSRKTPAAAIKRRKAESRKMFGPKVSALAGCLSVKVWT